MRALIVFVAFALAAFGQRHKLEEVDAEKPEGKLLQQVCRRAIRRKRRRLMEQFAGEFPKAEQTAWVLEQLQGLLRQGESAGPDHRRRR